MFRAFAIFRLTESTNLTGQARLSTSPIQTGSAVVIVFVARFAARTHAGRLACVLTAAEEQGITSARDGGRPRGSVPTPPYGRPCRPR